MKHQNDTDCPRCTQKLAEARNELVSFFYWVKGNYPEIHVSWSFRDQANQDEAFRTGKSKLSWPKSKHNRMDSNGNPASEALDLFVLDRFGKAQWPYHTLKQIADEVANMNLAIKWGGTFKSIGDFDHFELIQPATKS